jgi:excisionase family DNA binding protein
MNTKSGYINYVVNNISDDDVKELTTKEIAELIERITGKPISVRQVQREIKSGHIKAETMGGMYLVRESALKNYKRRHPGVQGKKKGKKK